MSTTPLKPRLTRLVGLVVTGATALSIAACSTSNNQNTGKPGTSASPTANPTTSAPKPPVPPLATIEGLVRSVSGNTIQLTQRDRTPATVDFTPTTMVTELTPAQLTDVTQGSCVDVAPDPASVAPGGAITAQSVTISPAEGGKCPPPEEPPAGSAGAPPPAPTSGKPAESPGVYGTVNSVTGNTVAVTSTDPTGKTTHTNVTVTNTTAYTEHAVTNAQAIQQGKCMAAQGTNAGGVLQAATIDIEPCPPMGGAHHHHFHLPHLHRH